MRTSWVAAGAALLIPVVGRASVIADHGFVTVYYEGKVTLTYSGGVGTACTECPYDAGDRISGTLLIDLAKAPPDAAPEKGFGKYDTIPESGVRYPSFVTGHAPHRGRSTDLVQAIDG